MNTKWVLIGMVLVAAIPVGMANSQTMVPDWVRQNMAMYGDGLIMDIDFINSIQYMISENIINVTGTSDYDDLLERQNILIDIMLEKERIEIHNEIIGTKVDSLVNDWNDYYTTYNIETTDLDLKIQLNENKERHDFYVKQYNDKNAEFDVKRLQYLEDLNNTKSQMLRCGSCLDTLERLAGVTVDPDV